MLVLGAVLLGGAVLSFPHAAVSADAPVLAKPTFADASALFGKYCVSCHSGPTPRAEVVLKFQDEADVRARASAHYDFFGRVAAELSQNRMPPAYVKNRPTQLERDLLLSWINNDVLPVAANSGRPDPGPFVLHRLNNREYANTVRELLYLPADYNAAADFPADERGDGFDNNSDTLTISPVLIEHYLGAAENAVNKAFRLYGADGRRDMTLPADNPVNAPVANIKGDFANRQGRVRIVIENFLPRAWRRPVTKEEVDQVMKFAALSFTHDGESFDKATALVIRAALMSPEFLFRMERDPTADGSGKVFQLNEYQLASRLSYFLWSTMPDDALFAEAKAGTLRKNLRAQVARMLKDPKSESLTRDFLGQWLEIRSLEQTPNVKPELLAAMKGETEHFFNSIIQQDSSIMDFLNADYTYVNGTLAAHYGIPGITGDAWQRVKLDPRQRGGIFTQASILTLTSKPLGEGRRTSPVVRGKWILENMFGQTIPPPPPNVPALQVDDGKELKGTVRQIFEQHRSNPICAGCHARMDPYGFALENYDGYGMWRLQDNHIDVDASGEINGRKFTTPMEFRQILGSRKDDFRRAFIRKMLGYALGRGIQGFDTPAVNQIAAAVQKDNDRFSSVIMNIVTSYPFDNARGSVMNQPQQAEGARLQKASYTPANR